MNFDFEQRSLFIITFFKCSPFSFSTAPHVAIATVHNTKLITILKLVMYLRTDHDKLHAEKVMCGC